ncbi:acyltransferase family protein [Agrobacterium vitis]|uniref:Acyltransferase n=1 Tax=Agrobacterium vitis TaxID=373 RepID=A0AAE2RF74_AGRVI|nr:acyltransferase [Agrobacterium vitis]MBF2715530.1 acyltransferase [Agrobacterium vitis]MUZ66314.1 acyltransferase family protein [Agrobacterium vitis]MVA17612.1 acyltransferase family protein [Agrobacterium vitis]
MKSIGSVLDEHRGIGPGFDFLRIFLAVMVLLDHSFLIAEGEKYQFSQPGITVLQAAILPMFFALSGFLITGSAIRLRLKDFLLNRGIRIVPALAVDIVFAALILGPLFTTVSLPTYFQSYEFWAYFANIFGVIHYVLPGVFEHNPFPATVNGSLWTVPYEIGCYAIMSALIIFGFLKRPMMALVATACVAVIIIALKVENISPSSMGGLFAPESSGYTLLNHFIGLRGLMLYVNFMLGSVFFLFRRFIPKHWLLAVISCIVPIATSFALPDVSGSTLCTIFAPMLVYLTVYVGMVRIPPIPIYHRGDYSYGIYLYGYPFQQALVNLFPKLTSPWLHFAISLPIATVIAMGSWHFIEKPILRLRKKFSFTAQKGEEKEVLPQAAAVTRSA